MKKVERLRWIQRTFGEEYVAHFMVCRTWPEIEWALRSTQVAYGNAGIRTDTTFGVTQGLLLPFVYQASWQKAWDLWKKHGKSLIYIVSESVPEVFCNGVAERIDDEHIFVEINAEEKNIAQRHMYDRPENLRSFAIGPSSWCLYNDRLIRCFRPLHAQVLGLDHVYRCMYQGNAHELTFSVRTDKRLIIW